MEVQRTTTEGKSVISDTLKMTYIVSTKGEKKELTGEIRKNDEVVGRFNASANGIAGISLHEGNGLTTDEMKQVFEMFSDDVSSCFK